MGKRLTIAVWLAGVMAGGLYVGFAASRLYASQAAFNTTYTYHLLFKTSTWLIPLAALVGVLAATLTTRRPDPEIREGKILRHDEVAFLEHWSHAASTLLLLISGVYLGFLFIPRLVQRPEAVGFAMNAHFVWVVVFVFGMGYYLTNTWLGGTMKEHLPEAGDLEAALADYKAKMGQGQAPTEGKYLASEKLSYPGWIVLIGGIVLTGSVKVAAHVWNLPGGLMGTTTFLHDLAALGVLLYLVVHVMAAAVVPWSWPLLKSMLTGYVSEEYVQKSHAKWYEELKGGKRQERSVRGQTGGNKPLTY